MPAVSISPQPKLQFFDANGNPLSGGKLYSYDAGTTTPRATYTDSTGNVANANPVILDTRGEASVWMNSGTYKLALYTSSNVLVWTVDGVGGPDVATLAQLAASGGSSLVGFLQSGTGAVTRTVQSKLRDTVSVFDFMTAAEIADVQAGTAVLDVTTALQAAINSGAAIVRLPAGTYRFTTLTIPEKFSLVGEGSTKTFLRTATSGNAITFNGTFNQQLHGFTLQKSGAIAGKGLYLIDQYFVTMVDVTVNGFGYGLYSMQAIYHYIRECKFENGAYGIYYGGSPGVWNVDWFNNVLTFENCRFNTNTTIGAYVKGCEVIFANCDWSAMTTTNAIGLKVVGESASYPAHGIQIITPYAETTDIIFSFEYAYVEINGGFVQGGAASGASAATSIVDASNSTVYWKGRPRDSDYWDYGYRLTNSTRLTFEYGFSGSVRASNTVDATSKALTDDYDEGTFTATLTGCTTSPTVTASYVRMGRSVVISIPQNLATSNSTSCTVTGLPAALQPTNYQIGYAAVFDTGTEYAGSWQLNGTTIALYRGAFGTAFTNSGTKGHRTLTIAYTLN